MMQTTSEISFLILTLSQLKGIGAVFLKKNLSNIRQAYSWADASTERCVTKFLSLTKKQFSSLEIQGAILRAKDILAECEANSIGVISIADTAYPKKLAEINDPPPILFFLGNLSLLKQDAITIVGTRMPNSNGKIIAERVGRYFASKGWAICNGLAEGIDTCSILEGEQYCFAKVIGIIGSGLTRSDFRSLPKQSTVNVDRILKNGGLVLSEMPPSKRQDTYSVIKSCRIQAGIGAGIILIQSALDGGSRFTVKAAVNSQRPLGVVHPIKADLDREDYAANRRIIEGGIRGLGEFVELKNGIHSNPKVVVLSSKDSYPEFESALGFSNQALAINI